MHRKAPTCDVALRILGGGCLWWFGPAADYKLMEGPATSSLPFFPSQNASFCDSERGFEGNETLACEF